MSNPSIYRDHADAARTAGERMFDHLAEANEARERITPNPYAVAAIIGATMGIALATMIPLPSFF